MLACWAREGGIGEGPAAANEGVMAGLDQDKPVQDGTRSGAQPQGARPTANATEPPSEPHATPNGAAASRQTKEFHSALPSLNGME